MAKLHLHCHAHFPKMIGVALWVCLFSLVLCAKPPEFTEDKFDEQVKNKRFTLVMFYAPWCGHCKRLKPSFEAAAEVLSKKTDNTALALVDCTTQGGLCSRFGVSGYPTVKLFKDGVHEHDFDGARDEKGIVDYMLQRSKPPSSELISVSNLEELLNSEDALTSPVWVTYVKSKSEKLMELQNKISSDFLGRILCAHTHNPEVLGLSSDQNYMRLYRPKHLVTKLTPVSVDYQGDFQEINIRQWILKNSHGLVGYRSRSNQIFFPQEKLVVFYHNVSLEKYAKGVNYYINRLIKIVQDNKLDSLGLTFAYSYSGDFYHELSEFNHDSTDFPVVGIYSSAKKYKLDKYEPDSFVQFLKDFQAGTLQPFIKSEPIPTEQSGPLKKVVALNFDSTVNDPTKDVFIMFHAPWCGHCKQLMPKFESVSDKLNDEPNVLLVTMDATANEVLPPYEVHGYPTLYFVPKASKNSPKRYEGPREVDDLLKYVASESTEELVGYDRKGVQKKSDL